MLARLEQILRERKSYDRSRRHALHGCVRDELGLDSARTRDELYTMKQRAISGKSKYFVDTNILIYATTRGWPKHERARN